MGRWAIVNSALGIIVLLLGLQIFFTWRRALPGVEVTSASGDAGGSAEGKAEGKGGSGRRGGKRGAADKAEQPTVLVTTIVNKDLFDASRQKPTEEAKAPPPPKEIGPPPNLTLVGVRMVGRESEAFVADVAQGNQQRRLRVGDEVGGYTLKTINPSRVSLASAAGESLTLTLNIEKSGGGGAGARPPGAPGAPGVPPRPGQPGMPQPGGMTSPAAGVQPAVAMPQSPAAGIQPAPNAGGQPGQAPGVQPRLPRAAAQQYRAAAPAAGGVPGQVAVPPGVPQPATAGGVAPTGPQVVPPPNPNLPAAVREKLEQMRSN